MPITKSAKKALRASFRKKTLNDVRKHTLKDAIKSARKVTSATKEEAADLLKKGYQAIDKAAKRGIIKKTTAARRKSRLAAHLKSLGTK